MQGRGHHRTGGNRHAGCGHHQGAAERAVRVGAKEATLALLNLIAGRVPNLKQGKVIALLPGANLKFFAEAFCHVCMLSFTYTRTCLSRRRVPSRGPPRPA